MLDMQEGAQNTLRGLSANKLKGIDPKDSQIVQEPSHSHKKWTLSPLPIGMVKQQPTNKRNSSQARARRGRMRV